MNAQSLLKKLPGCTGTAEVALKEHVLTCLQHVTTLIQQDDFTRTLENLIVRVHDWKDVSAERRSVVAEFIKDIQGKASNWAGYAFKNVRSLGQKTSRNESDFSSMKASGDVNVRKGVHHLLSSEVARSHMHHVSRDARIVAASQRTSVGAKGAAHPIDAAVGTEITPFAARYAKREYDAAQYYVVKRVADDVWEVSRKEKSKNAIRYGDYRTTYNVTLHKHYKHNFLKCECAHQIRNLMPCRHIYACKSGEVDRRDFHKRWHCKYALTKPGKFLNTRALSHVPQIYFFLSFS